MARFLLPILAFGLLNKLFLMSKAVSNAQFKDKYLVFQNGRDKVFQDLGKPQNKWSCHLKCEPSHVIPFASNDRFRFFVIIDARVSRKKVIYQFDQQCCYSVQILGGKALATVMIIFFMVHGNYYPMDCVSYASHLYLTGRLDNLNNKLWQPKIFL